MVEYTAITHNFTFSRATKYPYDGTIMSPTGVFIHRTMTGCASLIVGQSTLANGVCFRNTVRFTNPNEWYGVDNGQAVAKKRYCDLAFSRYNFPIALGVSAALDMMVEEGIEGHREKLALIHMYDNRKKNSRA